MKNSGERLFKNRQLGMRAYIRIVKIMLLKYKLYHIHSSSCEENHVPAPKLSNIHPNLSRWEESLPDLSRIDS